MRNPAARTLLLVAALLSFTQPVRAQGGAVGIILEFLYEPPLVRGVTCRRVTDPIKVRSVPGQPNLGGNCKIGKAELLCEPSALDASNVSVRDGATFTGTDTDLHLGSHSVHVCYRVSCKGEAAEQQDVIDPFGDRTVRARNTELFCVRAAVEYTRCNENAECGDGEFCRKRPGRCDSVGICAERPATCQVVLPEDKCGCDGSTYSSGCDAALAGTSVRSLGVCPAP